MTEDIKQREKRFLIGLASLTRETGIVIGGCGCCGSPSLEAASPEELSDDRAGYGYGYESKVTWIAPSDEYQWGHFRDSIVREQL